MVALLEGRHGTSGDEAISPEAGALRFAAAAAAITVGRKGAQPSIPSRAETLLFLEDRKAVGKARFRSP